MLYCERCLTPTALYSKVRLWKTLEKIDLVLSLIFFFNFEESRKFHSNLVISLKMQTSARYCPHTKQTEIITSGPFLTRECAHAHERVIAIVGFSLGRLVGSVVNFRECAVNEF